MFAQTDPQQLYFLVSTVATIVTGIMTIGAVFYKVGKMEGSLSSTVVALKDTMGAMRLWIFDLSEGKGRICAKHEEQLVNCEKRMESQSRQMDDFGKRLDIHVSQIAAIELQSHHNEEKAK
jgi:hypothetical protein